MNGTVAAISDADRRFLDATVRLAERGLYGTTPNPRVGCLLVRGDRVIGRGWHRRAGEAHAEALALADARQRGFSVAGCTCYVSLEPCIHQGRTPPCADALIDAGVRRVVVALADPDPRVAGSGLERLRAAGVVVDLCELASARSLNRGYVHRHTTGRPWLRLKLAASIDGRTALASGESRWITGVGARADVQYWRARSCAVLTGVGTVLADDPRLTVRERRYACGGEIRQPLRVLLDSALRTPPSASLFATEGPVLVFTGEAPQGEIDALSQKAEIRALAGPRPDFAEVLRALAERGCNEVLVECGPVLAGEVLRRGLWDELLLYLAPRFLGVTARPLADLEVDDLSATLDTRIEEARMIDGDLRLRILRDRESE